MSAAPVELELDDAIRVIVRDMLTITRATDLFLDDLQSRGYAQRTVDTYRRLLDKLADELPADYDIGQVTEDDCRTFFLRFARKAPGTRAHAFSVLSSFFKWLYFAEKIKRNPMDRMSRPRRVPAEDLDVVSLSSADVRKLIEAANTWPERLTINVLAYLGPRRRAVAQLRLRDYDQTRSRLRFHEKGGKTIWKPVPAKLGDVIDAAIAAGVYTGPQTERTRVKGRIVEWQPSAPDAYLIPPVGALSRTGERDDRVIWRIVKDLADRAGVDAHVHALRAAFAVFYLEQPGADLQSLKDLMGHRSIQTTQIYLRKRDKDAGMEQVRSLDWGDNTRVAEVSQIAGKRLESSASSGGGRI